MHSSRVFFSLLVLLSVGCREDPDPAERDDVETIGTITGSFSCPIVDADAGTHDLGVAQWEGDLDDERFIVGLRTQGCFARVLDADRGEVVSLVLYQQTSYLATQVLELNIPTEVPDEEPGATRDLDDGDFIILSGSGGFASVYTLDGLEADPELIARSAGGTATILSAAHDEGDLFTGTIDELRMGELR
jgi:hypothetical protein